MNDIKKLQSAIATDEVMKFPCMISIKAIGNNQPNFDSHILEIVRRFHQDTTKSAVSTRLSKNNNFLSVTVKINAQSRKQADDIYWALTKDKDVLMAI